MKRNPSKRPFIRGAGAGLGYPHRAPRKRPHGGFERRCCEGLFIAAGGKQIGSGTCTLRKLGDKWPRGKGTTGSLLDFAPGTIPARCNIYLMQRACGLGARDKGSNQMPRRAQDVQYFLHRTRWTSCRDDPEWTI